MPRSSAAFFVRKIQTKGDATTAKLPKRLDALIIAQAKQLGFSLTELNELTTQDFLDIVDEHTRILSGAAGQGQERRRATQRDIDALCG